MKWHVEVLQFALPVKFVSSDGNACVPRRWVDLVLPNVLAQRTAKPSAAATGYAWLRSRPDSRQPLIELCQKFIKPKCEPANADFLLIRPSVRVNARAIRIVLCVCQDEPPEFDYKRVNVHRILSIHNVEVRGATRLYRGASPRDVLHNPRESVVVRIGIGRKASFYSQ